MPDTPSRRPSEEIHRIVTAAVRECWETYATQVGEGTAPTPDALDVIFARATVPIVAQLDKIPPEGVPELAEALVSMMLGAFLDVTAHELARDHTRMLDVREREATKFAARAAKEIEVARRLAQVDAEIERLRGKGKDPAR
jgi:hypothetical protein